MKSRLIWLAAVLCMIMSLAPMAGLPRLTQAASTLHVGSGQTYSTIQDAINASAAGDTIIVHDGTYNENIFIDRALTVISQNGYAATAIDGTAGGDQPAVAIINSSITFGTSGHGFSVTHAWFDGSDPDDPQGGIGIAVVNSGDGDITGVSVQGNYVHDCGGGMAGGGRGAMMLGNMGAGGLHGNSISGNEVFNCSMGLALANMGAAVIYQNTVSDNTIHESVLPVALLNLNPGGDIYGNHISGNTLYDAGFGMLLSGYGGNIYGNIITDNSAHDSFLGITLGEVAGFSGVAVHDNTVEDNEVYDCGAGIVLSIEGSGSVSGNIVKGNTVYNMTPVDTAPGHGISLSITGSGTITGNILEGNTIYQCDHGISLLNMMGGTLPFTAFSGNNILDNTTYCASLEEGNNCGITLTSCSYTLVHGNDIRYNSEQGLLIHACDYVDVTGNRVYNNSEGILLSMLGWDINIMGNDIRYNTGATTGINIDIPCLVAVADNININYNNIIGNAPWGVCSTWNYSEIANATNNWWGSSSGPGGAGPGTGDAVSANLSYTPWLTQPLSQLPQMFYGEVKTSDGYESPWVDAPAGSAVAAMAGSVQKGQFIVTTAGQYGSHPGTYLIVQGDIAEGTPISFYVNGYKAMVSVYFESGSIMELPLYAYLLPGTPTPTATGTAAPTSTPAARPTRTLPPDVTPVPTATPTPTPIATPTPAPTATPTPTSAPAGTTTPTTTPVATATTVPTPTPTVIPAPTASPAPAPTPSGTSNIIINLNNTSDGLLSEINTSSADGKTTAKIPAGTQITDTSGQPVEEITIEPSATAPPVPEGYFLIEAFDFGPDGTTFSSAMHITLAYDLSQLPAGQEPVIAYYNAAAGEWNFVTGTVDTAAGTITFAVAHFTTFAVMGQLPAPADDDEVFAPWIWIVIGLVDLLCLILIIGLLARRRAARAEVKDEAIPDDDVIDTAA